MRGEFVERERARRLELCLSLARARAVELYRSVPGVERCFIYILMMIVNTVCVHHDDRGCGALEQNKGILASHHRVTRRRAAHHAVVDDDDGFQ